MMKRLNMAVLLIASAFVLGGCTNYAKQYDDNTLVVNKNGSLVEISVEDFKDSKVSADKLSAYIDEQIEAYNNDTGNVIKKKSIDTEDMSHVKLVIQYKDIESYNGFNLLDYSIMDIGDVEESDLTGSFTSADDKKAGPSDIVALERGKILTVSEATDIVIKGDILFYNGEVSVKDGVAVTSGKKDAIIVFK